MKRKLWCLITLSLVVLVFAGISPAQKKNNEKAATAASSIYIISANAGTVNYTSGKVSVAKKNAKSGVLEKGDSLEVGDKVTTGTDGRAEVLLNPGSYLRLSENSRFEFATTSLDDLKIKLNGGSAIFEVVADKHFKVTVGAGRAVFYLIKSGIYRVDSEADGTGKISVWKGVAQIGDNAATQIKGGQTASATGSTGGQTAVAKFDRDAFSDLEVWSKSRAKEIAKINEKLIRRDMNNSLLSSFSRSNTSAFGGYGLWVYDPFYGSSCFLPFGYGFRSAYGIGYNQTIWSYNTPSYILTQTNPNFSNPYNSNNSGNNQNGNNGYNNGNNPNSGGSSSNGGGWQRPPDSSPSGGGSFPAPSRNPDIAPSQPSITERHQEQQAPIGPTKIN